MTIDNTVRTKEYDTDAVSVKLCRRKSLRLQKLADDVSDATEAESASTGPVIGDFCTASIAEDIPEDGEDLFSPFPDPEALNQGEHDGGATAPATSTIGKADFQAARRRHSVMPAKSSRCSNLPLFPTTSSESTEGNSEQEQTRGVDAAVRKSANRPRPRVSTRRAPSRASTRRATR